MFALDARTAANYNAVQRDGDRRRNGGVTMEKTAQTTIRMTEAEREAWEAAAKADGRTLSAWIVRRCNGEPTIAPVLSARREARKPRPKRKAR
jgi:mobilization protein NikA